MAGYVLTVEQFTEWLRGYQAAWEGRDAAAAAKLFSDDASYHWTPLVPPQQGPAEIAAVWQGAVSQQRDIRFTFGVFGVAGATGMATWRWWGRTCPTPGRAARRSRPRRRMWRWCCGFRRNGSRR